MNCSFDCDMDITELKHHKFIVICVDHYNPLCLIRTLGEAGIKPIVIMATPKPRFVHLSKYIGKYHSTNSVEEAYELLVSEYGNEKIKPFVIPVWDSIESILDVHYEEIKDKFYFFDGGRNGIITKYMNKETINEAAASVGMRIPKAEVLKTGELPKHVPYPIITKAIMSMKGGWKSDVFICRNESELRDSYSHIQSETLLVEEFIEKKNELCIDGISINGGEYIYMPYKANYIRFTNKAYGNYMTMSPFDDKKLSDQIQKLIKKTGFSGIFSIEFLITQDDELVFLEVNFRHSTWAYASKIGGANLVTIWAKSTIHGCLCLDGVSTTKTPFKAMAELPDFSNHVIKGSTSLKQWIKDFRDCECTFFYNKEDKKPFFAIVMKEIMRYSKKIVAEKILKKR